MKIALATRPCVRIYVTAHCRFHLSSDRRNSTPHTFVTLNHPSQHQPLEQLVQDHKSCPFFRCNHGSSLIMSPLRTTSLLTCYQQEQGVRSRGPKSGTYKVFVGSLYLHNLLAKLKDLNARVIPEIFHESEFSLVQIEDMARKKLTRLKNMSILSFCLPPEG